MLNSSLNIHHERRLRDEGALLKARLIRVVRAYRGRLLGDADELHRLNYMHSFDVLGLVAVTVIAPVGEVILVTAPGVYMQSRRHTLLGLVEAARGQGLRCVLVWKRCLTWRARALEASIAAADPASRGRKNACSGGPRRHAPCPEGFGGHATRRVSQESDPGAAAG